MNLATLLDMHRARYLDHFVRSVRDTPEDLIETLLRLDMPAPDELYKTYRADKLSGSVDEDGLEIVEIKHRAPLEHEPFLQRKGESIVEVRPFHWNHCVIQVLADRIDRAALIAWGTHWIDIEDLKTRDEDRLKGVIHFIMPPTYPGGKFMFWVDFGTAPVRAVTELIKVLTIGSKSYHITLGFDEPSE